MLSHLKASPAVVAENKICHGLIGTIDLQLDETSLVTLTVLALKEAPVLFTLGLYLLSGPVCALVMHVFNSCGLALLEHLVAGEQSDIHLHKFFRRNSLR